MAVQSICQLKDGWEANFALPFSMQFAVQWKVMADRTDGPLAVATGCQNHPWNLPGLGDRYNVATEGYAYSICTGVKINSIHDVVGNLSEWRYSATFGQQQGQGEKEPPPGDPLPGDEEPNPLDRPEREWWEWESYQRMMTRDVTGYNITNSAGVTFTDPPVVVEDSHMIHVIQKNFAGETEQEKSDLVAMAKALKNASNSTPWRGYGPDECLMRPIAINGPRNENDRIYYEVQFRVRIFDPASDPNDTVLYIPLDLGTAELVTVREGDPEQKTIQREATDGLNTYGGVVKLDGYGKILADQNEAAVLLDGTDGKAGPWRLFKQADFNLYIP